MDVTGSGHKSESIPIKFRNHGSPSTLGKVRPPRHNSGRAAGVVKMPERAANLRADLILKAMIAVAEADGGLEDSEIRLMQQVYEDQAKRPITPQEIAEADAATTKDEILAELTAAAPVLDRETKEEIIRAAYLTLLADGHIASEERKKLKDIATALRVPEIHFGAILEDLALWLEEQKVKNVLS